MDALSIDVSEAQLDVYDAVKLLEVRNRPKQIDELLNAYPGYAIVLEPTSTYHLEMAIRAHRRGHTVYLVNPRDTHYFAKASNPRASTDPIMAVVLHEFLHAFQHKLRPWAPMKTELLRLKSLVRQWFHLSQMRSKLAQVFRAESHELLNKVLEDLSKLTEHIELQAVAQAKSVDPECYRRLERTVGFGKFSACAFTFLLSAKEFDTSDAASAFVGMDLRVSDSGKRKGKRFLSKRGDRILRYAITCAGQGLLNSKLGKPKNEDLKAAGRKHAERRVIAGRKLIRTIHALHTQKADFDPMKFVWRVDSSP